MKTQIEIEAELKYWLGVKDGIEASASFKDLTLKQKEDKVIVISDLEDKLLTTMGRIYALSWVLTEKDKTQ